jgi:hypothetical protein
VSQNYYNIYINSVLDLAQTIVIKSEESAAAVNNYLKLAYGESIVDVNDLSTWKYYQNICGQYHVTDEIITITSLDTLEKITFTIENLKLHRTTSRAYQFGTRHYIELLALHPDKEQIILGVLYPADMNYAITATDGTILSYPKHLIESNELTFIEKLNKAIEVYKIRWHNVQFGVTDVLYSAAHLGLLYLQLIPMILNIRLAACKTNEAHSFHVRQYLASHGMLDVYLNTLTLKQALFFYRNIAYIERNNGKREIFSWLVEHIMTERNLPLSEYIMKHNETDMLNNLYPLITFRKKAVNTVNSYQNKSSFTLEEVLEKERYFALGNSDYIDNNTSVIKTKFDQSLSSVLATKMLESSVIDYTDAALYPLQTILLNEWLDLSAKNIYNVYISFTDPRTGNKVSLISKDAYIYLMYIFARSIGSDIARIPSFIALRAQRIPLPSAQEVMTVADTKYIDISTAEEILSHQPFIPPDKPIVSVESFYNTAVSIFNATQTQIGIISRQEHLYTRALVYNMVCRLYSDNVVHFDEEGMLFADWLSSKELQDTNYTVNEYQELYKNIFEAATGSVLNTTDTIRNLQKTMIQLLEQLSSYSIQVVSEINNSNIKVLNLTSVRLGDKKYNQEYQTDLKNNVSLMYSKNIIFNKRNVDLPPVYIQMLPTNSPAHKYDLELNVKTNLSSEYNFVSTSFIPMSVIDFTIGKLNGNDVQTDQTILVGYNDFNNYTTEEKISIKDVYH